MKKIIIILILSAISFSDICDLNNDDSINVIDIVIMVDLILNEGEDFCVYTQVSGSYHVQKYYPGPWTVNVWNDKSNEAL